MKSSKSAEQRPLYVVMALIASKYSLQYEYNQVLNLYEMYFIAGTAQINAVMQPNEAQSLMTPPLWTWTPINQIRLNLHFVARKLAHIKEVF